MGLPPGRSAAMYLAGRRFVHVVGPVAGDLSFGECTRSVRALALGWTKMAHWFVRYIYIYISNVYIYIYAYMYSIYIYIHNYNINIYHLESIWLATPIILGLSWPLTTPPFKSGDCPLLSLWYVTVYIYTEILCIYLLFIISGKLICRYL